LIASAGIAHRNIRPETILIDGSKVIITEFAHATVVATESHTIQAEFVIDRHMLACTILYTLAGGRGADHQPLDFDELMEATETGFNDPRMFDQVKAGRLELADLLQAMVDPDTPLEALLARPFFWGREQTVAYLGEEIGNLLDPQATTASPHYAFMEALEAAASAALGGEYSEELKQNGPSWAAQLDADYPLTQGTAEDDPTGWGKSRSAQQAPADVEHTYAVYGKNPSAKQKTAREGHLKSGKQMPMANRRTVGLLKTIRNVAFAHRSQHVQFGRFDTEEDVMRYMIDPFPWLLMMVFQLDQDHKIAGSVLTTASDKATDTVASTDDDAKAGYSTDGASKPIGSKGDRGKATTSGDDSAGDKSNKAKVPAKGKPTKKPNKKAEDQKTKTIQMQKEQMKAMANQIKTHQMEIAALTKTNPSTQFETKAQPKPDPEPEPEPAEPEEPGRDPQRQPEPPSTLEPDEPTTQP
jgi:hypothetical protein